MKKSGNILNTTKGGKSTIPNSLLTSYKCPKCNEGHMVPFEYDATDIVMQCNDCGYEENI